MVQDSSQNALQQPRLTIHRGVHLPEVSRFVASIYHGSHTMSFDQNVGQLAAALEHEDRLLAPNSTVACLRDGTDQILATARLVRRGGAVRLLPCEREFGIDLDIFDGRFRRIYEFARLASRGRIGLLHTPGLLGGMLKRSSVDWEQDFIVAVLDDTVFRILRERNWPIFKLGEGKEYLGSLSFPVGFGLFEFGDSEIHLTHNLEIRAVPV